MCRHILRSCLCTFYVFVLYVSLFNVCVLRLFVFKCLSRANVCYAVHVVYMCECVSFNYACVLKTSFRSPQYISPLKMRNFLDWWRSIFQSTVSLPSFWNIDLMSKGIFLRHSLKKC